jgi:hypothetical protein
MKRIIALVLLSAAPLSVLAKPKVNVFVQSHEAFAILQSPDSLARAGSPMGQYSAPLPPHTDYFINVTVQVHDPQAPLTDAHWCIKGDSELGDIVYEGFISGNDLELEIPQNNGKIKKVSFKIIDRKWRERKNLP